MSNDGEVSVSVQAEGVEDAAGEMSDETLAEGGGGGGGDTASIASNAKRATGLLALIAGIVSILDPIWEVLGVVGDILEAFVAPLAVLLLRLLTPVLIMLLAVLPFWFDVVDLLNELITMVRNTLQTVGLILLGALLQVRDNILTVKERIQDLIDKILNLPSDIGEAVARRLPDPSGTANTVFETADDASGGRLGQAGDTLISIGGGLSAFVDEVNRDGSIEFP